MIRAAGCDEDFIGAEFLGELVPEGDLGLVAAPPHPRVELSSERTLYADEAVL